MGVDNVQLFQKIYFRSQDDLVPKLCVGPKSSSKIHSIINWILNLVYPKSKKDYYLSSFTTTLGYSVSMAGKCGDRFESFGNWRTLCHEVVHALQAKKWTRGLFGFLYLWPISQGIVLLLLGWVGAIWLSGWWVFVYLVSWLAVTGIHFIPHIPDPFRKLWEFEAYSVSMHLYNKVHGTVRPEYIDHLSKNFSSMAYYMMEPNDRKIKKELYRLSEKIVNGKSPVQHYKIVQIAEEEYELAFSSS